MNIKYPIMLDTSKWETIVDFAQVSPRPLLVITKATEGSTYTDPTFSKYWADLKQDGISRGAFHFHRKAITAAGQATNFLNALKAGGVDVNDFIVLDVEEEGTSATQILAWIDLVEAQYGNQIMIYSRANILDKISMSDAQRLRLKKYPIWTAGYPNNPDTYAEVPAAYIPNQNNWGPVWAWQYTDKGVIAGVDGNVDMNWMSPALIAKLEPVPVNEFVFTAEHWNALMGLLGEIKTAIKSITLPTTPTPDPGDDPVPASDGYIGAYLGTYRVIDDGRAVKWMEVLDSWGNNETVLMDKTQKWLELHCPGWETFVKDKVAWKDGDLWHIKLRVYRGQIIHVAEIANKRARIIGIDAAGNNTLCATELDAISHEKTPWYFHKVTNVPRWFPLVQPRTLRNVPGASWIPVELIEKV